MADQMTDGELLEQFRSGSQQAFTELVRRHIDWTFAVARRRVGDKSLAEDVVQTTFITLARKAPRLWRGSQLSPWLLQVVIYASQTAVRGERSRRRRETEAAKMQIQQQHAPEQGWDDVAPHLDELVHRLSDEHRSAILLRFYEQQSFAAVGSKLGISEDAARKRVSRAVDRLRALLVRRGVTVPSAALGGMLATHATESAPAALLAGVSQAASPTSAAMTPLTENVIRMMVWSKLRLAGMVVLGCLIGAGIVAIAAQLRSPAQVAASAPPPATSPATQSNPQRDVALELLRQFERSMELPPKVYFAFQTETTHEGDWNFADSEVFWWHDSGEVIRDGARRDTRVQTTIRRKKTPATQPMANRQIVVGPPGFEPKTILYKQDADRAPHPLVLSVLDPQNDWWADSMGSPSILKGLPEGGRQRDLIWKTMSEAPSLTAALEVDPIDGHPTRRVESIGPYGRFVLWLDPAAGCLPRRIEIHKSENDLFGTSPLSKRYPIAVQPDSSLSMPNVAQQSYQSVVDQIRLEEAGGHTFITDATITETIRCVDGQVMVSRTRHTLRNVNADPDFGALRAFHMQAPHGILLLFDGQANKEDTDAVFEWRGDSVVPVKRLYGRAVYDDGTPVSPLGWIARLQEQPQVFTSSTSYVSEIRKPDGTFSVTIPSAYREQLVRNYAGQLQIRSRQQTIGEVNIDRLGTDATNPPVFTFKKPAG